MIKSYQTHLGRSNISHRPSLQVERQYGRIRLSLPPLYYDQDIFSQSRVTHLPPLVWSTPPHRSSPQRSSGRPRPRNSSKTRHHVIITLNSAHLDTVGGLPIQMPSTRCLISLLLRERKKPHGRSINHNTGSSGLRCSTLLIHGNKPPPAD